MGTLSWKVWFDLVFFVDIENVANFFVFVLTLCEIEFTGDTWLCKSLTLIKQMTMISYENSIAIRNMKLPPPNGPSVMSPKSIVPLQQAN